MYFFECVRLIMGSLPIWRAKRSPVVISGDEQSGFAAKLRLSNNLTDTGVTVRLICWLVLGVFIGVTDGGVDGNTACRASLLDVKMSSMSEAGMHETPLISLLFESFSCESLLLGATKVKVGTSGWVTDFTSLFRRRLRSFLFPFSLTASVSVVVSIQEVYCP